MQSNNFHKKHLRGMIVLGITRIQFFLTLGILGVLAIVRRLKERTQILRFVEVDPVGKNFGAFPPEIPEKQFENFLP